MKKWHFQNVVYVQTVEEKFKVETSSKFTLYASII